MSPESARPRRNFRLAVDTELWDDDALWDLPVKERKRVQKAMMWGRPLPPRLARVAVQHAPALLGQAWYGWLLIGLSLMFATVVAATAGSGGELIHVAAILLAVSGLAWLFIGVSWLRAVARARRTVQTGHWPERS